MLVKLVDHRGSRYHAGSSMQRTPPPTKIEPQRAVVDKAPASRLIVSKMTRGLRLASHFLPRSLVPAS